MATGREMWFRRVFATLVFGVSHLISACRFEAFQAAGRTVGGRDFDEVEAGGVVGQTDFKASVCKHAALQGFAGRIDEPPAALAPSPVRRSLADRPHALSGRLRGQPPKGRRI